MLLAVKYPHLVAIGWIDSLITSLSLVVSAAVPLPSLPSLGVSLAAFSRAISTRSGLLYRNFSRTLL